MEIEKDPIILMRLPELDDNSRDIFIKTFEDYRDLFCLVWYNDIHIIAVTSSYNTIAKRTSGKFFNAYVISVADIPGGDYEFFGNPALFPFSL